MELILPAEYLNWVEKNSVSAYVPTFIVLKVLGAP
jgi:hypothetical protein